MDQREVRKTRYCKVHCLFRGACRVLWTCAGVRRMERVESRGKGRGGSAKSFTRSAQNTKPRDNEECFKLFPVECYFSKISQIIPTLAISPINVPFFSSPYTLRTLCDSERGGLFLFLSPPSRNKREMRRFPLPRGEKRKYKSENI